MSILTWVRARDPGLSALRRSVRAAIVAPGLFAIADLLMHNPNTAVFAAFGSLAMLLFVDFGGSVRERVQAHLALVLTGVVLICVGTLCAQETWVAAAGMLVVAFAALFVGIISSVLASATTAIIISFILPVMLGGSIDAIPDRILGWLMAGAASLIAITLLWPTPTREPLRRPTAEACASLARRLRAEADCVRESWASDRLAAVTALVEEAEDKVAALRTSFFGTPYRPTGLSTAARALVRLVDQVVWLDSVLARMPLDQHPGPTDALICDVKVAAAALLESGAELLESPGGEPGDLESPLHRLQEARHTMEQAVIAMLPVHRTGHPADGTVTEFVSSLEPSFRAQEMSFATSAIAGNIELTVAARRRSWRDHLLGRRPEEVSAALSTAQRRAGAQVDRHSVWLHNSVRGAIGLSLAVLVGELTGVQHSFWVVFGTLAVLRSNALNTGQNALRALLGTVVGIIIGGAIVFAIGSNTTVLWALLPFAVAFTGFAPAAISFTAGQTGFTMTLLILFNIIQPAGWSIGLVRVEDVAIGCAVSLVVGVLFWPRGAGSVLGQALAAGFSDGVSYLRSTIEYGVTRCDAVVPSSAVPDGESRRAAAAARRLDDAFREFLAERGTKHIAMADVTTLVTSVAVLRLTADAIRDLWEGDDGAPTGDRAAARVEIVDAGAVLVQWYQSTARALAGGGRLPDQLGHDATADQRLIDAVRRDLNGEDGRGTATAVKMIWTGDHIDAARRLQADVLPAARAVALMQQSPRAWLTD
ncbi:MAG TPA: FUSC family protein [Mycobacteriales bacterium]